MAAITECLNLIAAALTGAGLSVVIDRDEMDRIAESEGEKVALNWQGADATQPVSCANYFWTAQVTIEPWANVTSTQSPLQRSEALLATIGTTLAADPTFGGKFHDSFIIAAPASLDEMGQDRGSYALTIAVQYWTTRAAITVIASD